MILRSKVTIIIRLSFKKDFEIIFKLKIRTVFTMAKTVIENIANM